MKKPANLAGKLYPTAPKRVDTDEGLVINLAAIEAEFCMKGHAFWAHNKRWGWPARDGKPLIPRKIPGEVGRPGIGFLYAEVADVLEPRWPIKCSGGAWHDVQIFKRDGKTYVTDAWTWETYPELKDVKLGRHRLRSRFRKDGIESIQVEPPVPRNTDNVWVRLKTHVEQFAARWKAASESDRPTEKRKRLLGRELIRVYGDQGVNWDWIYYHASRDSNVRPGEKALRSYDAVDPHKGQGRRPVLKEYEVADVESLLAGEDIGRVQPSEFDRAVEWLETELRGGTWKEAKVVTEKANQAGISQTTFFRAWRHLKVMAKKAYFGAPRMWRLPPKERAKPAREKHLRWKQWHKDERLSHEEIRQRHYKETGEKVTRTAIILAIGRLN
jgi:hypothetical protein